MARRVRNTDLETRTARDKLKQSGKPYYVTIAPGLHIGYRKGKKGGRWVVRLYNDKQRTYAVKTFAAADDVLDADGVTVLDFWQAQERIRNEVRQRTGHAEITGPYTVADAVADYLDFMEHNRASAYDVGKRMDAHVLPDLGSTEVAALTAKQLRKWHGDLAKKPSRLRTRRGDEQQFRPLAQDDEAVRRRRASANRCLFQLKAALNRAWREGKVESDTTWRRVEPFENADAARVRYLSIAECTRLLNACDPGFRPLVRAALETGARYGELTRLTVADFNPDAGTLAILKSKTGKPRHVVLTDEGQAFFKQVCMGRAGSETMLLKADGSPWRKSNQQCPMADASHRAKIDPPINFHALRHTWASLSAMNGVPLLVVAKNLGHSDTRMVEKHYGHLAPSYIADAIRAGAPRFGFKPSNVAAFPGA